MKAAQYNSYGDTQVIEISQNAPEPELKENHILVDVHAASLNPFDGKLRQGVMKDMIPLTFPITLGGDFSGVVKKINEGSNDFQIGDEVYGQALIVNGGSGSIAQVTSTKSSAVSKKPKNVSFEEAASIVLVGVSAIQALDEHIKLHKGQKILIHGGAGGIGSLAVQLAKHLEAYVATTVGTQDIDYAKSLGADEVIDYKTQKFEEMVNDYDAVFDTVGGDTLEKSILVLKHKGILVSMVGDIDNEKTKDKEIEALYQNTRVTTDRLTRLTDLVEKEIIKPRIDKVFQLDDTKKAFDYLENDSPKGKVVVMIS